MNNKEKIKEIFREFQDEYDFEKLKQIWKNQSEEFRKFWEDKILNKNYPELSESDMDHVIKFFDQKARGAKEFRENGGLHAARANIFQGQWYRALKSIKNNQDIKGILDDILKTNDGDIKVGLVNKLKEVNEKYKNGLTGKKAVILNAILFTYSSDEYVSMLSLEHRFTLIEFFDFGKREQYESYGEQIVNTNRDIISSFKDKFDINIPAHLLSYFIYDWLDRILYWNSQELNKKENVTSENENEYLIPREEGFVLEKHLEDFLVANWESTDLGKLYELIEESGEIVSQQYPTKEIGNIDLLVKDKNTNNYVVIELKKGQTSDRTIGQLSRYMGWVKKHKANGNHVKGIIIAGSQDKRLEYALQEMPNIDLFLYKLDFGLEKYKRDE